MSAGNASPTHQFPERSTNNIVFPARVRVNSQNGTYIFPSPTPSPTKENYHPYGVKTTSTGILTRSNSSAGSTFVEHSYSPLTSPSAPSRYRPKTRPVQGSVHRFTKSLSSTGEGRAAPASLPSPPPRTRSRASSIQSRTLSTSDTESTNTLPPTDEDPTVFDSESDILLSSSHVGSISPTIPPADTSLPSAEASFSNDGHFKLTKELCLPDNPKFWTSTNLSLYLGTVLSVKRGGSLCDSVIREVQIHIIRTKVTGRQFMRLSQEDVQQWGFDSTTHDILLSQAQSLRQNAVMSRIYGFDPNADIRMISSPDSTPSRKALNTLSYFSSVSSNPTHSRPRTKDVFQDVGSDAEEQDHGEVGSIRTPGWISRAMHHPRSSHASSKDTLFATFTATSRRSLGRLSSVAMRGRVKGMVESFETASVSEGESESDASAPVSAASESSSAFLSTDDERVCVRTRKVIIDGSEVEGQTNEGHRNDLDDPDATISTITLHDEPTLEQASSVPLPTSPSEPLITLCRPSEPQFTDDLPTEPSVDELLVQAYTNEGDGSDPSHPWDDPDVPIGETARKVSVVRLSRRRFSAKRGLWSSEAGDVSLEAVFTPLPDSPGSMNSILGEQESASASVSAYSTAPPSYSDQAVEAFTVEKPEPEIREKIVEVMVEIPVPFIPDDMNDLIVTFQSRLTELECKLDEMEMREAARVIAEAEASAKRARTDEEWSKREAVRRHPFEGELLKQREQDRLDRSVAIPSDLSLASPGLLSETSAVPIIDASAAKRVSIGVATEPEISHSTSFSTDITPSKAPKRHHAVLPNSRQDQDLGPYLPDNLPQFIIGAGIGVIVIVLQSVLKKWGNGRRL